MSRPFGWVDVARLGLVQAALGAVVVLTTSTLNRVMVVELGLPAVLPGALVALHYLVQLTRPRMGHGGDLGQRRTPWILGGMGVLALGGALAAVATVWMASRPVAGAALATLAFLMVGAGVSASGTSLLALLATRVAPDRRAGAATLVWLMMIAGFALTAGVAGTLLDPYSPARLVAVSAAVSVAACLLAVLAVRRLEGPATSRSEVQSRSLSQSQSHYQSKSQSQSQSQSESESGTELESDLASAPASARPPAAPPRASFRTALASVWSEPVARRFTVFVFVSMLAYSAQDLILEPYAGLVFGYTPGASTRLSGVQHAGVLLGMIAAALAGRGAGGRRFGSLRAWQIGGCMASALALLALAGGGLFATGRALQATVFVLGVANGAFSIAAIATMMRLAGAGTPAREGIRMGLWGAAQALAFGLGGLLGTVAVDVARQLVTTPATAYAAVFGLEALLFVAAARLAASLDAGSAAVPSPRRAEPALERLQAG